MAEIVLERLQRPPIAEQKFEIVERKGLGHPDSICDAVMEEIARAINGEYQKRFGEILHNNIDKGLLVAGRVSRRLGGGRVLRPIPQRYRPPAPESGAPVRLSGQRAAGIASVNIMRIPCFGRRITMGRASMVWPGASSKSYFLSRTLRIMRICSMA